MIPAFIAFLMDVAISNQLKYYIKDFLCENEIWNDIYSSNINANIAILGASRAWVHFDTKIFNDSLNVYCYNFGEDGSNILLQYLRFKEYTTFNPSPKIVILSVDLWTLKNNDNKYPTSSFFPYMFWNTRIFEVLKRFDKVGSNKLDFFIPMLRYLNINTIKLLIKHPKIPYWGAFDKTFELNHEGKLRANGYRGMDLLWDTTKEMSILKMSYEVDIDYRLIYVMETLLKELIKNNIEVIMVYTPEYREGQCITKNRNENITIFENASRKFNIPFYNYSDSIISEKKELFYNVQHLNKNGAEVFTKSVVTSIIYPHYLVSKQVIVSSYKK